MGIPTEKMQSIALKPGQVYVLGKIDNVRKFESKFYTRIVMPAADEYSSPSVVEVESEERIGDPGDNYKGSFILSGYRNDFKTTDKSTGEIRHVKSARNTLRVTSR